MIIDENTDRTAEDLAHGLTGHGNIRALLVTGSDSDNRKGLIADLAHQFLLQEPSSYYVIIDGKKINSPSDFVAEFGRCLRTKSGASPADLSNFALSIGKSTKAGISHTVDSTIDQEPTALDLADILSKYFSDLTAKNKQAAHPTLLLVLQDLHDVSDETKEWFCEQLNHSLRKYPCFKNTRFVFSSNKKTTEHETFFDQFGFETVRALSLPGEDENEQIPIAEEPAIVDNNTTEDLKRLNNKEKSPKLETGSESMNDAILRDEVKRVLNSCTSDELSYLQILAYPSRISRYSLEFFSHKRIASLAYNWLKRKKSLHVVHPSGDLVLDDALRTHIRTSHANEYPEQAESFSVLASVLDTFFSLFPNSQYHWLVIDLSVFTSFTKKLLLQLYQKDKSEVIETFWDVHFEGFQTLTGGRFCLNEKQMLVVKRLMELTDLSPTEGIVESAKTLWDAENVLRKNKFGKLEAEKTHMTTEFEDFKNQVTKLDQTLSLIVEAFRNPKRKNSTRQISFSTSKILVFAGIATMGLSLFSESLGSYHAASGLLLSLFGFFWPSVEIKKSAEGAIGLQSNLALDTQQKSLQYRKSSLLNRMKILQSNLDNLQVQLDDLSAKSSEPYVTEEAPAEE